MADIIKEWDRITDELSSRSAIFQKLVGVGKPRITDEIPTACVSFNEEGACVEFLFNPDFAAKLNTKEAAFILAHEMLHILFNHYNRLKNYVKRYGRNEITEQDKRLGNEVADVIINNTLLGIYDFTTNEIKNLMRLGLLLESTYDSGKLNRDKMAKQLMSLPYFCFEDIFRCYKANNSSPATGQNAGGIAMFGDITSIDERVSKILGNAIKADVLSIPDQDLEKLLQNSDAVAKPDEIAVKRGIGPNPPIYFDAEQILNMRTRNWERIVHRLSRYYEGLFENVETWAVRNRRNTHLPEDLMLLNEVQGFDIQKARVNVQVYMDFSGSCVAYSPLFFSVAHALPNDMFNAKYYGFGSYVSKAVDMRQFSSNLTYRRDILKSCSSGTSFAHVRKNVLESEHEPDHIFVITDGYGGLLRSVPRPETWHFFIWPLAGPTLASQLADIPPGVNTYPLYSVAEIPPGFEKKKGSNGST